MSPADRRYLMRGLLAWLPMPLIAVANAAVREGVLLPWLGADMAQPASGLSLIALLGIYTFVVLRRATSGGSRWAAWALGAAWAALTLAFEFALIAASSPAPLSRFAQVLSPVAVAEGNLFVLVVVFLVMAPALLGPRRPADTPQ